MGGGVTSGEQPTPYELGRAIGAADGPVERLYSAEMDARDAFKQAEAAYKDHSQKTMFFTYKERDRLGEEYARLHDALVATRNGLLDGAFEAFMDARPEHLQEMLANPEAFFPVETERQYGLDNIHFNITSPVVDTVVGSTLLKLASQVPNPEIFNIALAKVGSSKKKEILDEALFYAIHNGSRADNAIDAISCFLQAGATATTGDLKSALCRDMPAAVIDRLIDSGADYEYVAKNIREEYSYIPATIEFTDYRRKTEATIAELQETVRELTEKNPSAKAPRQKKAAPASTPKPG